MERSEIHYQASGVKTTLDLAQLLSEIKEDALGIIKARAFQEKQITYYCNPKRTDRKRYINFTIPKKSGGERTISAPVRGLKSILFSLNTLLQALYEPSKYAMGFTQGRSVVDNAKIHIGQRYIYNIDLKDFFPSIDKSRVWKRLTLPPFNFNSDIAHTIAGLCTMRIVEDGKERFVLPQGAPTSPILTNAICDTLDRRLGAVAKRFGLRYSRYADDITFSSMHYVYGKDSEFIKELHRVIKSQNFTINESKTRLQSLGYRQEVTGVIISDKINVAKRYTREIKTLLHIWDRYGYMAACESYTKSHHVKNDNFKRVGYPKLESVIAGKLQYMKMVKGAEDAVYQTLQTKFSTLVKGIKKIEFTIGGRDIAYLQTMTREQFRKEKLADITIDATNKVAYYEFGDQKHNIVISRSISEDILSQLATSPANDECWNKYRISLCENNNVQFYLLHKCFKERKFRVRTDIKLEDIDNIFTYLDSPNNRNENNKITDKKSSNIFERVIGWLRR
ncbi:MAG: RNA-directed DNA polymerase [Alistipes sp.]|nr:RNA-directed DNA polymerase [Alistipes sp.]